MRGVKELKKYPTWMQGDTIGVLLNLDEDMVYFYKNGEQVEYGIGVAKRRASEAFFVVVLMGRSERVKLAHGSKNMKAGMKEPKKKVCDTGSRRNGL